MQLYEMNKNTCLTNEGERGKGDLSIWIQRILIIKGKKQEKTTQFH